MGPWNRLISKSADSMATISMSCWGALRSRKKPCPQEGLQLAWAQVLHVLFGDIVVFLAPAAMCCVAAAHNQTSIHCCLSSQPDVLVNFHLDQARKQAHNKCWLCSLVLKIHMHLWIVNWFIVSISCNPLETCVRKGLCHKTHCHASRNCADLIRMYNKRIPIQLWCKHDA